MTGLLLQLIGTVCDLLAGAFLARFALQWARASFGNPVGHFVLAVTDWAVRPTRRVIPGLFGLDLATLLLAWLVEAVYLTLSLALGGAGVSGAAAAAVILAAALALCRLAIYLAMGVVIVGALLSWINPYAPIAPFFFALSRPLLRPFQRLIPPIGGVDLSPIALLLVLQVLLTALSIVGGNVLPFLVYR
jgi:YggT family protein